MFDRLTAAIHTAVCSHEHDGVGACGIISSRLVDALGKHQLSIVDEVVRKTAENELFACGYSKLSEDLRAVKVMA